MATALTPRCAWINAGLKALATGGPDAVRIESLARTLQVTKGGFYGYFRNRGALLEEMLDTWEQRSVGQVIDKADREGGTAVDRARLAADLTFSPELLPIDLAIRDWARFEPTVARRLAHVDNQRMEYLRSHFRATVADPTDLEARCLLAFCAAIASDLIAAEHPGQTRDEVLRHGTELLFPDPDPPDE